ncbi:MAG: nitrile hydratase accessory protein [Halobacterium sp.]
MTRPTDANDGPSLPDVETDRDFAAPWQARAFGLAVAATDAADLDWERFQARLVAELERRHGDADDQPAAEGAGARESAYYEDWLAALERLLVSEGHLESGELAERVAEFEAGDRTAHEFVDGDPHSHADDLPEGHAEGSAHDHGHSHDHSHSHGHSHGHSHSHGEDDGHDHDSDHDGGHGHDHDGGHDGNGHSHEDERDGGME